MKRLLFCLLAAGTLSMYGAELFEGKLLNAKDRENVEWVRPEVRPFYGLARGVSNLATCWLEIPRCTIYDNIQLPMGGAFSGLIEGTILMGARVLSGVADLLTLGCTPRTLPGQLPDFVWSAVWIPDIPVKK